MRRHMLAEPTHDLLPVVDEDVLGNLTAPLCREDPPEGARPTIYRATRQQGIPRLGKKDSLRALVPLRKDGGTLVEAPVDLDAVPRQVDFLPIQGEHPPHP